MNRSFAALVLAPFFAMAACGGDKPPAKEPEPASTASAMASAPASTPEPMATAASTSTTEAKPEPPKATNTIVDVAMKSDDFKILVELVKEAGLVDALKGAGPLTVFAPNDAAFKKIAAKDLEALKKDKEKLAAVLKFHVVSGKVMAADAAGMNGKKAMTLNGAEAAIKVTPAKGATPAVVMIDKAKIIKTDIAADNGVIHVIDTVMMPPAAKPAAKK
jgi:uncharacterized surface protein with fasciclin (FAS1) repeats